MGLGYKHPRADRDARYESLLLFDGSPFSSLGYASVEYVYSTHWTNLAAYHPQDIPYPPVSMNLSRETMEGIVELCGEFCGWRPGVVPVQVGRMLGEVEGKDGDEEEEGWALVKRGRKR